ncbi:MAG: sulfur oxidation c-type cytochrome SoxX [Rhodobacteraceae bacterium]|jgi:sulfur-oxidizing protein SoxX|nr:sulfur oxidation c-type cytochrome SoxX [Paracoccaceae bacterium]
MNLKAVTGLVVAGLAFVGTAVADTAPADVVWEDDVMVTASLTGAPGSAEAGVEVLTQRSQGNCVACHEVSALPNVQFQGNVGPALDGVASRWTEAELRGILVDAKHMFPETRMPAFYRTTGFIRAGDEYTGRAANPETFGPLLSAQQIEDTLAYLMTLTD